MFINMTPHKLDVLAGRRHGIIHDIVTIPPSGRSVRVGQTWEPAGVHDDVNLYHAQYGAVETIDNATKEVVGGLPPAVEGTIYIVSGLVLEAVKAMGRNDFASPGELIRNDDGQPIGCNGFKV